MNFYEKLIFEQYLFEKRLYYIDITNKERVRSTVFFIDNIDDSYSK